MRLSKTQAIVITFLNILIVALVVTIFLVPTIGKAAEGEQYEPTVEPLPEHVLLRESSAGKVSEVLWETRLMGSGDETVVDVFFHGGVTYVFGNATVADLDFSSYGGFLCRVDESGKMLSYTYFDGNIGAVGIAGDGYAVGAGGHLYFVDRDGKAEIKAETDGAAVDIMSVDEEKKLAVVTQPDAATLRLTEYSLVGDFAKGRSTRIDSGFTLKFFDCFAFEGRYCIAARAYALPRYDACVFFTFEPGGDATPRYYGGSGENLTRPYAVMPCDAGYFVIAAVNGLATVLTMNYAFTDSHTINLGFAFSDAKLCYNDEKYYAGFAKTDGTVTYEFRGDLSRRKLSALDGLFVDCVIDAADGPVAFGTVRNLAASLAGGDAGECVEINSVKNEQAIDLDIKGVTVKKARLCADGNAVLVLSAKGGDALSAPSGGTDVYIIKCALDNL